MRTIGAVVLVAVAAAFAACGGESAKEDATGGSSSGGAAGGGIGGSGGGAAGSASGGAAGAGGGTSLGRCGSAPPAGAAEPDPPPAYSGGTCPTLVAGKNTIVSSGNARELILVLPKDLAPTEKPPLIFLWHWLGGDAQGFLDKGQIQAAADAQRFIAVIPEKKGDVPFTWPVEIIQSQARVDEELTFFDDMFACVTEQFSVDRNCVSSAGVSAGALFTDQLAGLRAQYLASFISLSGGVGGVIRGWTKPSHKLPGLVLWGGPGDSCVGLLSFESLSKGLEAELANGGHFFVECIHNCGHAEPPFQGATSKYQGLWDFALDHPYWLGPGESPYTTTGLPASLPEWCGIGQGSATPRTGECLDPSQC